VPRALATRAWIALALLSGSASAQPHPHAHVGAPLAGAVGEPQPALAASAAAPRTPSGSGKVFLTLDEALQLAFGEAHIERSTVYLTDAQFERARELAGSELPARIVHPYVARKDGALQGSAYVETHRVRTLRETLLIVVDPQGRVRRIELLAFGEPLEYIPRGPWYAQFIGRTLDDELNLRRGIRGVTGATLTASATTHAVRRALALHTVLQDAKPVVAPAPPALAPRKP
jgi:electron transport complex protein RnfG